MDPVHAMSILPKYLYNEDHVLNGATIVAMASITKVLVVLINPGFDCLLKFSLPETNEIYKKESLPYVSWGLCTKEENYDPVLAIGWGKKIYLIRVAGIEKKVGYYKTFASYTCKSEILHIS
jgi:hypothetical protein